MASVQQRRANRCNARVIGRIESMGLKAFAEKPKEGTDTEDRRLSQVFQDMILMRHQIYATVDPEIELHLPGGSDEELVQSFKEALEHEQQRNPYTYEVALGFSENLSQPEALSKLARYESTLDRSLYRALHELQRLQALRKGTSAGPPAAVDVDVSIGRK